VIGQHLRAGLAQPLAVLLETPQNDHVALVHQSPAKPRHIPRAPGICPPALRGSRGDQQEKRDNEKKSDHLYAFMPIDQRDQNWCRKRDAPPHYDANSPTLGAYENVLMLTDGRSNGFSYRAEPGLQNPALATVITTSYDWSAVVPYPVNSIFRQTIDDVELPAIENGRLAPRHFPDRKRWRMYVRLPAPSIDDGVTYLVGGWKDYREPRLPTEAESLSVTTIY